MSAFAPFLDLLAEVPDPRRAEGKLYKLPHVLLFSILAVTFALNAGLCVRRVRFVMFAPDPRQHRRCQAGKPLIDLSEFPEPSLSYG